MRSKSARDKPWFFLVLGFELFKHRSHCARVVARCIHVLDAKFVSLFFGAATKLHEDSQQSDSGSVLINHSGNAAEEYRSTQRGILQ